MPSACNQLDISWDDVDEIFQRMEPNEESLQLFLNGQIPAEYYLDNTMEFGRHRQRIHKHRFYAYLEQGASLVINRAEDFCVAAEQLSRAIGKYVAQPASGNLYINFQQNTSNTRANHETTFGKHWDTHDVFAIQLIGKKRWRLFPPTLPLPLSYQTSKKSQDAPPQIASAEYVLQQGDILYIPRGWWHEVVPLDEDSMHLSVGTYAPTLTDYVMWAMNKTLPQLADARRGFCAQKDLVPTLEQLLHTAIPELLSEKNITQFMQQTKHHERLKGGFHTALTLRKNEHKSIADYHFSLSSIYPWSHQEQDLHINGGRLRLSPVSRMIIAALSNSQPLNWEQLCHQLPTLTATDIETSVVDLARHDVITIQ